MMVVQAHEREVVQVGRASGLPGHHMVDVGEGDVGAAREAAMAVPPHHLAPLGLEGVRRARPSYMVCPTSSSTPMAMVASQAIRRTVSALIRPSRSRSPASASTRPPRRPGRPGGRGRPRSRGWRWPPGPARRGAEADELDEGVTEALVPRRLAVGGDLAGPGLETGPGLGVGLGGQSGRSWCEGWSLKRKKRRSCEGALGAAAARAMSASSRTEYSLAWLTELPVGLGGGHVGHGTHLVQGQVPGAERPPPGAGGPRPSRPHGVSARAVGIETPKRSTAQGSADVAPSSRYTWRRPTSPKRIDDLPLDGGHLAEEPVETLDDLLVRQGGRGRDRVDTEQGPRQRISRPSE